MKILILGSDGRAHALAWKLFSSSVADEIFCAPGNGGTSLLVPSVELDVQNPAEIGRWAFDRGIELIVPTDETVLLAGLVDEIVSLYIAVCGPPQRAAQLAFSRCATHTFLHKHDLAAPRGRTCTDLSTAEKYLAAQPLPIGLRADRPHERDGIYTDRYTALEALRTIFSDQQLNQQGKGVIIEEALEGAPISFSAITDGQSLVPLLPVRTYDRLESGDGGLVAPGMGAHSSTSNYAIRLGEYLQQRIMHPLLSALARDGIPHWGVLGIDCIITNHGPKVITLRNTLRSMEAEVLLPRMDEDILPVLRDAVGQNLGHVAKLRWRAEPSVGIGLMTQDYPRYLAAGGAIHGLSELEAGTFAFHNQTHNPAGMRYQAQSRGPNPLFSFLPGSTTSQASNLAITTTGGHPLSIVASGSTLEEARRRALRGAECVTFTGRNYRDDIGAKDF